MSDQNWKLHWALRGKKPHHGRWTTRDHVARVGRKLAQRGYRVILGSTDPNVQYHTGTCITNDETEKVLGVVNGMGVRK